MKIIRLIFAMYILLLTVHPCSDQNVDNDEFEKGTQVAQISDLHHSNMEQEVCTPFCICSCCAAHIRLATISSKDFTCVHHNTKETIPYLEKQVLADDRPIWQPPKV